jgi:GNAT superfamily N-acetyltransferase
MVSGRVALAETDDAIARCFAVMAHLRPTLLEGEFVARVRAQQAEGYKLAYLEDEGEVVAVAGFRTMEMLVSGRTMYVDDLVTDQTKRSRGYGKTMLDWLQEQARTAGCKTFSLDSGTHRQEAHAFYFREGMRVTSFHFAKPLD